MAETQLHEDAKNGGVICNTTKKVLVCLLDTLTLTISLPSFRIPKVHTYITDFPSGQRQNYCRKWDSLIIIFQIITPELPGRGALFAYPQVVLVIRTSRFCLTAAINSKLEDWGEVIKYLTA